jgi:hypothetical protein
MIEVNGKVVFEGDIFLSDLSEEYLSFVTFANEVCELKFLRRDEESEGKFI